MKRIVSIAAIALIAGLALTGCGSKIKWEEFTADNGNFSILMAGEVEESTQMNASMLGMVTIYIYQSSTDEASFTVSYNQMPWPPDALTPAEVDQVLEESVEGAKQDVYNVVSIDTKDVTIEGHPGKEFDFAGVIEGVDVQYNGRLFMVGNEFYQLLVVSELGSLSDADIRTFFDSFKLN